MGQPGIRCLRIIDEHGERRAGLTLAEGQEARGREVSDHRASAGRVLRHPAQPSDRRTVAGPDQRQRGEGVTRNERAVAHPAHLIGLEDDTRIGRQTIAAAARRHERAGEHQGPAARQAGGTVHAPKVSGKHMPD